MYITIEKFKSKLNDIISNQLGDSSIVLMSDKGEDIEIESHTVS